MRTVAPLLLMVVVLLLSGCGDSATEPDSDLPADTSDLVATGTIGTDGGSIEGEGIVLTVPAGAFDSNEDLSLYVSKEADPFGEYGVSNEYRIDGLPDACGSGLKIRIAHDGTLSDSSFIALGQEAMVAATGDTTTSYDFIAAIDSSGYLVCDVPGWSAAKNAAEKRASEGMTFRLIGLSRYLVATRNGGTTEQPVQYDLRIPPGLTIGDATILVDDALATLVQMGYKPERPANKMLQITLRDLGETYARFVYRNRDQAEAIVLNHHKINSADLPAMKVAVGREVYRWVLFSYTYDPYYPVMVGPNQQDYAWLTEAMVDWVGEKFAPADQQGSYIPPDFAGNEEAPFRGMQDGVTYGAGDAATRQRNHGHGMAAMIKYLSDWLDPANQGNCATSVIHSRLGSQPGPPKHPVEALASMSTSDVLAPRSWFPTFISKYCFGWIYGVRWQDFIDEQNVSAIVTLDEESDTLAVLPGEFADLSAKRYLVQLQYDRFPENTTIEIKLDTTVPAEDLKIYAYKIVGERVTQLGVANKRIEIPDVKALREEFADIFFFVVNSSYHAPDYARSSEIRVEVRVKSSRELNFQYCTVYLHVDAHFQSSDGYSWDASADITGSSIGSFTGNQFTSGWDPGVHGSDALGGINIRMNAQGTTIEEFVFAYDLTSFGITYTRDIRASNLPFIQVTDGGRTQYGVEGEDLIDFLDEASDWMISGDYNSGFGAFEVEYDSYLFVEFQ